MNSRSIRRAWLEAFPNTAPAGHVCRSAFRDRWLRTHSLPESKRYPRCESELAEVLFRYNAVASEVLGEDAACILFVAYFGETRLRKRESDGPFGGLDFAHVMSHGEDDETIRFFAVSVTWRAGQFDVLLSAVAEDQDRTSAFLQPASRHGIRTLRLSYPHIFRLIFSELEDIFW